MALAGDHVLVQMDDSSDTLRTFDTGDIISIDLGEAYQQHDVTGFGDEAKHFINGQIQAPVTIRGYVTTTANTGTHTVINDAFQAGATVTLNVAVGNNTAPTSGDPEYSGEFLVTSYRPMLATGSAVTFQAQLVPATGTAPTWGTLA